MELEDSLLKAPKRAHRRMVNACHDMKLNMDVVGNDQKNNVPNSYKKSSFYTSLLFFKTYTKHGPSNHRAQNSNCCFSESPSKVIAKIFAGIFVSG